MSKYLKITFFILFLVIIVFIFRSWFSVFSLSTGDWTFKFPQAIEAFRLYPYAWDNNFVNGLGGNIVFILPLNTYFQLSTFILFNYLYIPWVFIEKIIWFFPFILISIFSSYSLSKKILSSSTFAILSSFIYLLNTYSLMIIGGGQMGVAQAYAISPFIIFLFICLIERVKKNNVSLYNYFFTGAFFSILLMFDLRIAYVLLIAIFLAYLFFSKRRKTYKSLSILIIPFIITIGLHFFWLLPFALIRENPLVSLGQAFSGSGMTVYLSFAKLENTISLLHPNWSENIFGKVYFMRPEFLILPILVFCSLLFISNLKSLQEKKYIIYFVLLGLIGAFLAKGTNDPFGNIYIWMFEHVPGFMMFRDATKFYVLIALSYSILIPFTVLKTYEYLKKRKISINKFFNLENLFAVLVTLYLLFLIRPAILGQLSGTFKPVSIPNDYIKLKDFFSSQETFFRTFWIPQHQRFGYYSSINPVISGKDFYLINSPKEVAKKLKNKENEKIFQEAAVKYVIVPYDSEGEIFLKDREYDEKLYLETIKNVREITWLKELKSFGRIAVFEVSNPKDHFYINSQEAIPLRQDFEEQVGNDQVQYEYINPTKYLVKVKSVKKGDLLVFSESFDPKWVARNGVNVKSEEYNNFNSFILPRDGTYSFTVYYEPQKWVNVGLVVSSLTLTLILIFLGFSYLAKK